MPICRLTSTTGVPHSASRNAPTDFVFAITLVRVCAGRGRRHSVQVRESKALHYHVRVGPSVASTIYGGRHMMFKRSQLYIGLGLAAVVELVIRVVVH